MPESPKVAALAVAAALLLVAAPTSAQTSTYRTPDGRYGGRAETGSDGTTRYYDERGRNAGRAERRSDGSTQFYGSDGRYGGEWRTPGPLPDWGRERQGLPRGATSREGR